MNGRLAAIRSQYYKKRAESKAVRWLEGGSILAFLVGISLVAAGQISSAVNTSYWARNIGVWSTVIGGLLTLLLTYLARGKTSEELSKAHFYVEQLEADQKELLQREKVHLTQIGHIEQLSTITGQLMSDWPNLQPDGDLPIEKRLRKAFVHQPFEDAGALGPASPSASDEINLIADFVGNDEEGKMWVERIRTEQIADEVIDASDVATDYLCVISANQFTQFLNTRSKSVFFSQFIYFSKFDREELQRDRITRVFSVPCKKPKPTELSTSLRSRLTKAQVHRLFCLLWINWSAGVDTKYHCYYPGDGEKHDFFGTADYVLSHSPSSDEDPETLYVAIPGDETWALKFNGTPILRRIFTREFYSRLSVAGTEKQQMTKDFLYRFRKQIFADFRASSAADKHALGKLLGSAVEHLCNKLRTESESCERATRIEAEYERWFEQKVP